MRPEGWKWSSFGHYATGAEGVVEIESQWTARKRERLGVVTTFPKAHPPAKTAGKGGATGRERALGVVTTFPKAHPPAQTAGRVGQPGR